VGGIFTADINGEYVLPGTLSSNKLDAGSLAQLALAGTLVGNLDGAKVSAGTLAEAALTTALQAKIDAGGGGGVTNLTNTIIFLSGNANAGRISVTNRNVEGGEQGTDRMTNSPVLLVDNLGNTTGDYSGQNVGEVLFKDILGGFGQLFYLPQHGPTVAANGASSQLKLLSSGGLCIMTIMNWSAGASTNMPGNANRELQWGLGGYGQPYSRFQSSQVFHGWTGADTNNSDAMFPMFFQAITYTNAPGSPGVSTFAGSDTNGYQLPALTFSGYGTNGAGVLTFWDNLDTEITASEQWNNMGTTARKRLQIITGPVEADRGIAIYGGIKINGAVGLTTNYTLVSGDTMSFSNGVLVAITPPAAYTWDASVLSYMTISQGGTNTYATNTGFAGYVGSWFEATNLNAWIKAQKAHGTWTYCDAIYPLTGPYPSNAVYNLRTNSWNITWAGTPTCSATGMVFNGSSQAGDTHYIPTSAATISGMGLTNGHIMLYVESFTVQAPFDFLTGNGGTYYDKLFIAGDSTTMQGQLHNLSSLTTLSVPSEKRGPWLVDCVPGEGNVTLYNYATSYSNALSGTPHLDDVSTAIGARGLGGSSFDHWAKCTLAGAQLGAGIPAALVPQMLADWNAFQQVMGRKVP
jgi:hypothetical protein